MCRQFRIIPEAAQAAFAAAQAVDLDLKTAQARKIITGASTAAGAAAIVPSPFSDAIALVPIQIGMIVGISVQFGIEVTNEKLLPLAASIIGCIATTVSGRVIAGQLLKLIPGGSIVNAGVALALTSALGEAFLAFLLNFNGNRGRFPVVEEIAAGFTEFWKSWSRKGDEPFS